MDINRFTEKSREALTTAQGLAAQYGHQEVDAEHLALALVNQEDGFVPRVLERVGVAPKALVTGAGGGSEEASFRARAGRGNGHDHDFAAGRQGYRQRRGSRQASA